MQGACSDVSLNTRAKSVSAGCLVPGCAGAVLRPQPGCRRPGYHGEDVGPPGVGQLADAVAAD
eukprot:4185705-Heterocapsa_arctica.AAC.1